MKKVLFVALAAAAMLLAGTQVSAQVSFGFGPAARVFLANGESLSLDNAVYGVQVGLEESSRVSDYFGYSAGVELSTFKKDAYFSTASGDAGLSEMYVDIPVRLKIYIPFSYDLQMFIFGGPVPSVCIGSHVLSGSSKESRFGENSNYSRFDVLAGGGIGLEAFEHLKVSLSYDHGLLNRDKNDNATLNSALAKFTIAYMF